MRLDQAAGDGEPEPCAVRRASGIGAPKSLEHAPRRLCREPRTGVLDGDTHRLVVGLDEDGDRAIVGRVAERVREQVEEYALDLGRLAGCCDAGVHRCIQRDAARPCLRLDAAQTRGHDGVELGPPQLELERTAVDARQFEKVVHERTLTDLGAEILTELRRYHPLGLDQLRDLVDHKLIPCLQRNMERGHTEGFFRNEVDSEQYASAYFYILRTVLESERDWIETKKAITHINDIFLHGVLNTKGMRI